jgi:hypothetical protein
MRGTIHPSACEGETDRVCPFRDLAQAAQALTGKLTDAQARQVPGTSNLQSAFGWSATSEESTAWAEVIVTLLQRSGETNYVSAIVELLKYPIAAGLATNVLLEALRMAIPSARAQFEVLGLNPG